VCERVEQQGSRRGGGLGWGGAGWTWDCSDEIVIDNQFSQAVQGAYFLRERCQSVIGHSELPQICQLPQSCNRDTACCCRMNFSVPDITRSGAARKRQYSILYHP
jgi:hypothetical protein